MEFIGSGNQNYQLYARYSTGWRFGEPNTPNAPMVRYSLNHAVNSLGQCFTALFH
jgi:hypothetical protein